MSTMTCAKLEARGKARGLRLRLLVALAFLALNGCGLAALPATTGFTGLANFAALDFGLINPASGNLLIIGHRGGASGKAPENTIAAFRLGPTLGATILECDVHCSKDGALVVIHDTTVDRTTNGNGAVRSLTLAQIKDLNAGNGERVPTLDELLAFTASQPALGLVIEIKAKKKVCPELADKVIEAVNKSGLASRIMIISFHRNAVEHVEQMQPALRTGLLFLLRLNPLRIAKAIHADAVWPGRQRTTSRFVESALDAQLGVYSWTLDAAKHILDARRVGVDGVVTRLVSVPNLAVSLRPL